jgi:hypothetical protein
MNIGIRDDSRHPMATRHVERDPWWFRVLVALGRGLVALFWLVVLLVYFAAHVASWLLRLVWRVACWPRSWWA